MLAASQCSQGCDEWGGMEGPERGMDGSFGVIDPYPALSPRSASSGRLVCSSTDHVPTMGEKEQRWG